jgi:hypothetical protein
MEENFPGTLQLQAIETYDREEKRQVINVSILGLAVPSPPLTFAVLSLPGPGQDGNLLRIIKKEQVGVNLTQVGEVHVH